MKLGDVRETPTSVADNSPSSDITAELVDVGEGTNESDYAGKDLSGKVVEVLATSQGELTLHIR